MSGTGYKLLDLAAWHGGKWYVRRRLPSRRKVLVLAAGGLSAPAGTALLARRLAA